MTTFAAQRQQHPAAKRLAVPHDAFYGHPRRLVDSGGATVPMRLIDGHWVSGMQSGEPTPTPEPKATADSKPQLKQPKPSRPATVATAKKPLVPVKRSKPFMQTSQQVDPTADREGRAECRRFLNAFGPVGAVYFCDSLTFQQAKTRYRQEHAEEHEDLRCKTGSSVVASFVQRFGKAFRRPKHQQ